MNSTSTDQHIYLGIKGHVVKIDPARGEELWRTKLKSSTITNIVVTPARILAHSGGHLFALDPERGEILWENELDGLGYGFCTIGIQGNDGNVHGAQATTAAAQQAMVAASIATSSAAAASSG
ncbi:outer membrane biogenesis protein BamB [Planctomycetes bacterium Pla163]|uniref:Outer membrane biogenesis protein BamB n=1 Tax=Rohdeia mirabilis TaxID=2528008 RepID=A0A518D3C9_9BACT|nr:outer membrane biogenesis protein BamB [Planctomycetes bacterium Pla163]